LNDFPHITPVPDTFICGDHLTLRSTNIGNEQVLWSTGETSPEITLSQPATVWYKVTNSQGCSNADTFAVQKMAIASLDYTTRKADCYSPGGLEISNQDILNGKPPYGYQLVNDIDSSTTEDLNHLREGLYTLEVINANGCVLKYSPKLLIAKDCLNDKPVFTPNADGMNDRYFINFEGRLEVFDRNGRLRRRLTGPCYFDGKDENGHPLSMGVYLIVSEKKQTMTLTIVR
jgi:hypothetical protein